MNTIGNVRYQFTEEIIEKAVLNLLKRKNYDKFTVKDICHEAGINRSSFYAHYLDINDLMIKIENKLAKKINTIFKPDDAYDESVFTELFKFVKENKIFYKAFLKSNAPSFTAPEMLKKQKSLFKRLSNDKSYNYSDSDLEYHIHFFGAGLKEICKQWLNKDCLETPEDMAKIITSEYANNSKYFK